MLPWLSDGEKIRILPAAGRRLRRGDIALYRRSNGQLVLHRVVQVGCAPESGLPLYGCLGDAAGGMPEPVAPESVIGVADVPRLRRWVFLALEPSRRFINRVLSRMGIRLRHG
jgi:hypothetical protein